MENGDRQWAESANRIKKISRTNREVIRFGRMNTRSLEIVHRRFVICRVQASQS